MANTHRHIEVVSSADVSRTVESYRAKIELAVRTRKKHACLDESLALRDQTISALEDAGIDKEHIEDYGGHIAHESWSSSKGVVHALHVTHSEMSVLVRAMANVERVFAGTKQPWFSEVKKDFAFSDPTPKFADDPHAAEDALKKAVVDARTRAEILAQEAGLELGDVLSIVEEDPQRLKRDSLFDADSPAIHGAGSALGYTPAAPRQGIARTVFRVRFAVKEGA